MVDGIGFTAAGLVLATFCMRSMRALRFVAIASNVAFIAYGYLGHLAPVLWLHALLLPVNICRLMQLRAGNAGRISFCPAQAGQNVIRRSHETCDTGGLRARRQRVYARLLGNCAR